MADFNKALQYVLSNEGGFVNISLDAGGPTNRGITLDMLSNWRKYKCSDQDIENLTFGETVDIYEGLFWNPLGVSDLDQSVATVMFDTCVNEGQYSCIKLAQMAIGIRPDGIMGPETKMAIEAVLPSVFIKKFFAQVQDRYVNIVANTPSQAKFLKGWLTRSRRMLDLI